MKRALLLCLIVSFCLIAQQTVKITYRTTQSSVQDIVRAIATQAGLGYNWQKSFDQTNPVCRRWVRDVSIEAVPFETAMRQILDPVGLLYEIENGSVVLLLGPTETQPAELGSLPSEREKLINYSTAKKSVQFVVSDIAAQVGLGYNFEKSFAKTDPECRTFVFDVSIKKLTFQKAMQKILDPVGLRYEIEAGKVVLYRGDRFNK